MERVSTIFAHRYPYPHEHSQHAIIAVVAGSLFFISVDNIQTLIHKLDNNIKWWSMYACFFGFLYFFSSPFLGRTIQPNYSNFSRCYCGNRTPTREKGSKGSGLLETFIKMELKTFSTLTQVTGK